MSNQKTLSKERYLELKKEFVTVFNDKSKRPKYYGKDGIYKTEGVLRFKHFMLYALLRGKDLSKICHRTDTYKFRMEVYKNFRFYKFMWSREVFPSITEEEFDLLVSNIKEEYFNTSDEDLVK